MSEVADSAEKDAGLRVVETPFLPSPPSVREWARRLVRHGLADVLAWLGEDVGPKPEDQTHVIRTPDALFISPQVHETLRSLPRGKTVSWDVPLTRDSPPERIES